MAIVWGQPSDILCVCLPAVSSNIILFLPATLPLPHHLPPYPTPPSPTLPHITPFPLTFSFSDRTGWGLFIVVIYCGGALPLVIAPADCCPQCACLPAPPPFPPPPSHLYNIHIYSVFGLSLFVVCLLFNWWVSLILGTISV